MLVQHVAVLLSPSKVERFGLLFSLFCCLYRVSPFGPRETLLEFLYPSSRILLFSQSSLSNLHVHVFSTYETGIMTTSKDFTTCHIGTGRCCKKSLLREGMFSLGEGGRAGEFWYFFQKKVLALPHVLIKKLLTPPPPPTFR